MIMLNIPYRIAPNFHSRKIFVIKLSLRKYYLRKFLIIGTTVGEFGVKCMSCSDISSHSLCFPQPSSLTQHGRDLTKALSNFMARAQKGLTRVQLREIACMLTCMLQAFFDVAPSCYLHSRPCFMLSAISDSRYYSHVVRTYINFNELLWNYEFIFYENLLSLKIRLFTKIWSYTVYCTHI